MYCFKQEGSHDPTLTHKLPDNLCTVAQIQGFIANDCCLPQAFSPRLSLSVEGADLTDTWLQSHPITSGQSPLFTVNVSAGLNRYFAQLPGTFDRATSGECWKAELSPSHHRAVQQRQYQEGQEGQQQAHEPYPSYHNSLYNEDDVKLITDLLSTSTSIYKEDASSPQNTRTTLGPSKLFSLFTNGSITSLLTSLVALSKKSPFEETVHVANAMLVACLTNSAKANSDDVIRVSSAYLFEAFSNLTHSQYLWPLGAATVRKVRGPRELGHDTLLKLVFEDSDGIFGSACEGCVAKVLTTQRPEDSFRSLQVVVLEALGAFGHCSPLLYDTFFARHKRVVDALERIAAGIPLAVSLSVASPPALSPAVPTTTTTSSSSLTTSSSTTLSLAPNAVPFQPSLTSLTSSIVLIDNEPIEKNNIATKYTNDPNDPLPTSTSTNTINATTNITNPTNDDDNNNSKCGEKRKADEAEKVLRETTLRFLLREAGENKRFQDLVMTATPASGQNFHRRIAAFTLWYSTETSPEAFFAWARGVTQAENAAGDAAEEAAALFCGEALVTAIVRYVLRAAPAGESFPAAALTLSLSPSFSPLDGARDVVDEEVARSTTSYGLLTAAGSAFCPLFLSFVGDFVGDRHERCGVVQALCDALVCRPMLAHSAALREQSARVVAQIARIRGLASSMLSRLALAAASAVTPAAEVDLFVRAGCLELAAAVLEARTLEPPRAKAAYYAFCILVSCVQGAPGRSDLAETRPEVAALTLAVEGGGPAASGDELAGRLSRAKARAVAEIERILPDDELRQVAVANPDFIKQIFDLLEDTDEAVTVRFAAAKTARLLSLLPASSPLREHTVTLLMHHINEFRGDRGLPQWHFDVLAVMLRGLYDACVSGGAECQRMLREKNVFIVLFRLLSLDLSEEHLRFAVYAEVLRTMYGLLFGSREGHAMFHEEGYFTQLLNALAAYPNFTPPHKVAIADRLFDILTETKTPQNGAAPQNNSPAESLATTNSGFIISVPLIKHPIISIAIIRCLSLIQQNYRPGDSDVAAHIVKRLKELITGLSIPNISALCKVDAIAEVLSILEDANKTPETQTSEFAARIEVPLIEVVVILGRYSMTPSDLKRIIRILSYSGEGESRIPSFPYYVEALKAMAVPTPGPSVFYDFDGISSNFTLPTFERWPFAKGMTFATWMNIQSFRRRNLQEEGAFSFLTSTIRPGTSSPFPSSSKRQGEYRPTIFSFETQEGQRLTLNIKEHHINFCVTSGPNSGATEDYTFVRTEIPKGRWFFLAFVFSPPRLLTSGEIRLYINGYLTERYAVRSGLRGTTVFQRNTVGCLWSEGVRRDPQVFFGQFGSLSFFDDALGNAQVQGICALGPNYLGSFQGTEWERSTVMNYSCKAQNSDYSLNNIPTSDDRGLKRAHLCGVGACRVTSLREIIVCTEGVKVLFPLVLSLNKPPAPTTHAVCKDDARVLESMMDLVHNIVCGSCDIEDEMLKAHGYAALARIFKSIPARFISPTLVLGLKAAYNALGHNVPMQNRLYTELLTDFSLWVFTPFPVQAELADLLKVIDAIDDEKRGAGAAGANEEGGGGANANCGSGDDAMVGNGAGSGNGSGSSGRIRSCSIDATYVKKKGKEEKNAIGTGDGSSSGSAGGVGDEGNSDENSNDGSDDEEAARPRNRHTAMSVQQILNVVRMFYWDSPSNPWSLSREAPVSPHTGEALGACLRGKEAGQIREKLFSIVAQRIEAGKATRKDVEAVLGELGAAAAVAGTAEEAQCADITGELLVALTRALNSAAPAAVRFAEMFNERGGMSALHGLVSAQSEELQVRAIDSVACFNRAFLGRPGCTIKANATAASLHQSIMKRQLMTARTYSSLIRMAVSMPPGGAMRLEYPEVLCFCILQLALTAAPDVRRQVLRDLSAFLDQGVVNALRVFECKGWQPPFCQFIASFSSDADEEITVLATKVVANIIVAAVIGAPTHGGWWNIGYFFRLLADFGRPTPTDYYRTVRLNSAVRFIQVAQKFIASPSSLMFITAPAGPTAVAAAAAAIKAPSSSGAADLLLAVDGVADSQDSDGNPLFKKTSPEAQVLVGIILAEYDFLVRTSPETTAIPPLLSQPVAAGLPIAASPPLDEEASQWARKEASLLIEILTCFANMNILTLPGWGNACESDAQASSSAAAAAAVAGVAAQQSSGASQTGAGGQGAGDAGSSNSSAVAAAAANTSSGSSGTNLRVSGGVGVSVLAAQRILQIAGRVGTECTGEVYSALDIMSTIVDAQLGSNKGSPTAAFCFMLLSTVRSALEAYKNKYVAIAKEELEFVHKLLVKAHWKRSGFVIKRKSVLSKENIALVTEMSKTSLAEPSADMETAVAALESKEWALIAEELRPLAEEFIRNACEEESAVAALNERTKDLALNNWKESINENQGYITSSQDCIKADVARIVEHDKKHLAKIYRKFLENNADSAYYWNKTLRELKSGRGPWGTEEEVATWKMDRKENYSRMRLKLKRNYAFDPHEGAAVQGKGVTSTNTNSTASQLSKSLTSTSGGRMQSLTMTNLSWLDKYDIKSTNTARDVNISEEDGSIAGVSAGDFGDGDSTSSLSATASGSFLPAAEGPNNNTAAAGTSTPKKKRKKKSIIYEATCNVIKPGKILDGVFTVGIRGLSFKEDRGDVPQQRYHDFTWAASVILTVQRRRYMLVQTALEIFFVDHTNVFINFADVKTQREVYNKIVNGLKPPNLRDSDSHSPAEILRKSGITQRWQRREISNFDYLMELNTIAGRTYNDLRQYPVFPWILTDYTSESLDLTDPGIYRDLSKPMGALNPKRLQVFRERLQVLVESGSPPFLYGSHYSSADVVFFYMIRVEPITSYFLRLQSRYDYPDRMFHSVAHAWNSVYNYSSDVKELIPEFFYYPDFLRNSNNFDFGARQTGEPLGDVVLPPWAHGSPEEFVRINREALESEYVSAHLHEWIDLIFGYKQRGEEAIKADNLFCYVSYEGAVDLNKIESEAERISIKDQIANFGQTPSQLLRKPHPPRGPAKAPILRSIFPRPPLVVGAGSAAAAAAAAAAQSFPALRLWPTRFARSPVAFLQIAGGNAAVRHIVTVTESRIVQLNKFIERRAQEVDTDRAKGAGVTSSSSSSSASNSPTSALVVPVTSPPSPTSSLTSSNSATSPATGSISLTSPLCLTATQAGSAPIAEEAYVRKRSNSRTIAMLSSPAVAVGSAGPAYGGFSLSGSGPGAAAGGVGGSGAAGAGGAAALPFGFECGSSDGRPIGTYFAQGIEPSRNLFAVGGPGNEYVFSCGYWDNSFRVSVAASGAQTQRVVRHSNPVTCVRYCAEKDVLVTGSRDTTVMLWKFVPGDVGGVIEEPIHTLYGHDDEVTSLDASVELDIVASGSRGGLVVLHTLRDGRFTWSTKLGGSISLLRIVAGPGAAVPGAIVAYSKERHTLYLHSINGRLLAQAEVHDSLHDLVVTRDGKYLVTAGKNTIEFWYLCNLRSLHRYLVPSPVMSLDIDPEGTFLAAGLHDGCVGFVMRNDSTPLAPSGRPLNAFRMTFSKLTKGGHASNSSSNLPSPASIVPQQPQQKHSSLSSISEYI